MAKVYSRPSTLPRFLYLPILLLERVIRSVKGSTFFVLPWTIRMRKTLEIRTRMLRTTNARLARFSSISTLSTSTKQELFPILRSYELQLAYIKAQRRWVIQNILVTILRIGLPVHFIGSWIIAVHVTGIHPRFTMQYMSTPILDLLWMPLIFLIPIFPMIPMILMQSKKSIGKFGFFLVEGWFLFIAILFTATLLQYDRIINPIVPQIPGFFIVFILSVSIFIATLFLLVPLIYGIASIYYRAKTIRYYPDAFIIDRLLTILLLVERVRVLWKDTEAKYEILLRLEEAAEVVEKRVPQHILSGDANTNSWAIEQHSQIAASLRQLKQWILLPRQDTREQFLGQIAICLTATISGHYDKLPRCEPAQHVVSYLWRSRFMALLKGSLVGAFPLIILFVIQLTPLALAKSFVDYWTIGSMFWTVLSVFVALDPYFHTKISALKDLGQLRDILKKPGP